MQTLDDLGVWEKTKQKKMIYLNNPAIQIYQY